MQKLKFIDPVTNKEVTARWSDLIAMHEIDDDCLCKLTKLNHATL